MKSFKEHLVETPMKADFQDIYKRDNKKKFNDKALKGELELEDGGKLGRLSKDDLALKQIMSVDDERELDVAPIRSHIKTNWGINTISKVSKDMNGLSIGEGGASRSSNVSIRVFPSNHLVLSVAFATLSPFHAEIGTNFKLS